MARARNTDPFTSHEAAQERRVRGLQGALDGWRRRVLETGIAGGVDSARLRDFNVSVMESVERAVELAEQLRQAAETGVGAARGPARFTEIDEQSRLIGRAVRDVLTGFASVPTPPTQTDDVLRSTQFNLERWKNAILVLAIVARQAVDIPQDERTEVERIRDESGERIQTEIIQLQLTGIAETIPLPERSELENRGAAFRQRISEAARQTIRFGDAISGRRPTAQIARDLVSTLASVAGAVGAVLRIFR